MAPFLYVVIMVWTLDCPSILRDYFEIKKSVVMTQRAYRLRFIIPRKYVFPDAPFECAVSGTGCTLKTGNHGRCKPVRNIVTSWLKGKVWSEEIGNSE